MIRPVTCLCFLLACASGLYLYQSKHRVQVLDRDIEQTVRATDALREQTRVLHAEWTLLNDPQRLQALADQFLSLKPVAPGQFTSMAELDKRLPPIPAPEPVAPVPVPDSVDVPVAQAPEAAPVTEQQPTVTPVVASAPAAEPVKAALVAAVAPARVAERKPAPPRPPIVQVALPRPESRHAAEIRPIVAAESPRPVPVMQPATGSMLGMAHGVAVPLPRPMPMNPPQWISNVGGAGG